MEQAATIPQEADTLREEFALFEDWRDRIEYIIDLGKDLPTLAEAHKVEANKVRGCQSQVWLVASLDPAQRRLHLEADSDAHIVRGLIRLLLRLDDNRTPREVLDNPPTVLEEIGLQKLLTPGRANGLYSMVGRIRQIAEAYSRATSPA